LYLDPIGFTRRTNDVVPLALLVVLLDLCGLRFVRYRVEGLLAHRRARETAVRFDEGGVWFAPVEDEASYVSFGWPALDVLSLPQGAVVVQRAAAKPLLYIPKRELAGPDRLVVETLARRNGGRVLDGPRGREIPSTSE
ncbi:MAG TPA: hypothetical protein VFP10_06205, partial [Candidatus Eisenbacteria bacterium]|nr:hypothetical protein [Candidatus Eisenbacteria bacterium]